MRGQIPSLILLAGTVTRSLAAVPPLSSFRRNLASRQSDTPSVNLGYEVHTATVNETGDYYIFSNVPYADQPTREKRFQRVGLPTGNSSTVNDGSTDYICYQAYPEWIVELQAGNYPGATIEQVEGALYSQPGQTEACLVLDVYVPSGVFSGASSGNSSSNGAPVLLWIHGGGFTYGSKTSTGDPAGIIARSNLNDNEGVIFISINYRLGMFGWLGGDFGLTANLGLYDQRTAFDWVQKYISLFGGDPSRVTVIGESAGAASILHHITSNGGEGDAPAFAQGIIQSPAFQFNIDLDASWNLTLTEASNLTGTAITTAAELTALDISVLQAVNFDVVLGAPEGLFNYGPTPDGTYVPALPQVLLAEEKFHTDINVMAAHNSLEAAPFVSSAITSEADILTLLDTNFPELSNATIGYLLTTLYPSSNYASEYLRAVQIASDADFACATRYIAVAKGNETYNYLFAYPPGYHAQDTSYTFFNGDTTTLDDGLPVNAALAYALQDYIVGFAIAGNPNESPAGPTLEFPVYGENATVVEFTYAGLVLSTDDDFNARCAWWQQAMVQGLA